MFDWLRKNKKSSKPENVWKEKHWDKGHVMTGKDLCKWKGHDWEYQKNSTIEIAKCRRCNTFFNINEDGSLG